MFVGFLGKPSGPGLLFVWSCIFKVQIVFHFQWLVYSSYLFLFDSVLMGQMFLETCPFFLGCQICCHIIAHSILCILHFCSVCCDFFAFIFYFIYLGFLSFLLDEPGQSFVNFPYPIKESALRFIVFFQLIF